jgi:arabinogalactan oligomer/maltooligosaccharide transport system permease protein
VGAAGAAPEERPGRAPAPSRDGRRLAVGLAVGLLVGVGGTAWLLRGARAQLERDAGTRRAIVSLLALGELVGRAGDGDALQPAVAGWQRRQDGVAEARVVLLPGARLAASTAPDDAGDRAAPRRLAREEKPAYDRAQRLRGAVTSNREGGATKPELEVQRLPAGGLSLAAPLEQGGEPAGMVELVTRPPAAPAPPLPIAALVAIVIPLAVFLAAARALGARRAALAVAAALALAAGVAGHGVVALRDLSRAAAEAQASIGAHARAQGAALVAALQDAGLPRDPSPSPGRWDVDPYRAPRALLAPDGTLDGAAAAREREAGATGARRTVWAGLAAGLLLLAAFGRGTAGRAWRSLVEHRQAYAYVAPAMLGTLVLVFFPFFYGIALSFTDQNIYNTSEPLSDLWIGVRNYAQILGDFGMVRRAADGALVFNYLNFYWTFLLTVIWTVTNVTWGVSFGLLLALVLDTKGLALRPVYRVLLILPWATPNYITALVWKGMFHRQFGVVNQLLAMFGHEPISWFDTPFTSFLTALATNGWLSFPFMMVVSLGALQSIPADLYEAARVDGASRWQQFKAITLPSLRPALIPAVILSVIWTFNMFNIIYLVTAGQPNGATEILVTQAYKYAFERYRYGYAAAYSTVIFGILLAYGTFQNRVTRATEAL